MIIRQLMLSVLSSAQNFVCRAVRCYARFMDSVKCSWQFQCPYNYFSKLDILVYMFFLCVHCVFMHRFCVQVQLNFVNISSQFSYSCEYRTTVNVTIAWWSLYLFIFCNDMESFVSAGAQNVSTESDFLISLLPVWFSSLSFLHRICLGTWCLVMHHKGR